MSEPSIPEPEVPLNDICSVIWDNTLYTYSASAFQALRLEQGAEWQRLESGHPVEGAACVGVTPDGAGLAALWVVGGQSSDPEYNGLQRYLYDSGTWETINAQEPVARNRRWHGATYLPASNQIVTYAGNTDSVQHISTTTFTIRASEPYDVQGYDTRDIAPAVSNPLLLRWSASEAVMIGGGSDNRQVNIFNPDPAISWTDPKISLETPLDRDTSIVRGIVVEGDDGSKNLITFDMGAIPNKVTRVVLAGAGGEHMEIAAQAGDDAAHRRRHSHSRRHALSRRDLTLTDWPTYNSTYAPDIARHNFALAEGPDGMVVIAGGNPDSPLTIFDVRENSWENAVTILADEQEVLSDDISSATSTTVSSSSTSTSTSVSTTTSSVSSFVSSISSTSAASSAATAALSSDASPASATASASESAAAAAGSSGGLDSNAILGIVLGSITGAILLLGLALWCLRRKSMKRNNIEGGHLDRSPSKAGSDEKIDSAFAKEIAVGSPGAGNGRFRGHQPQDSHSSFSSMAILMGQMNQQKPGQSHERGHMPRRSSASSTFTKGFKSTISHPIPQVPDHPALQKDERPPTRDEKGVSFAPGVGGQPRAAPTPGMAQDDGTRRSSGWNRYWSGGSALNILGYGQKRMTVESDDASHYSNQNRVTQDSATVPPLNLEGRPQMNRVMSGSPTISNHQNFNRQHAEMSGKIERPVSTTSSGYSSGVPESVRETWDPLSDKKPWGAERAPSSAYSESFYHPTSLAPSTRHPPPPPIPDDSAKRPHMATPSTASDMSWLRLGDLNNPGFSANDSRI